MSPAAAKASLLRAKPAFGNRAGFLLGAGLGVAVFLLLYGPSTLNVTYDSWIYAGYIEQDIIQRYAGWLYYRAAPWEWPLAVAGNLSVPYGASIVFTDSIPLVSVVLKALSPLLPETFQFFGWYNLVNFALQGGFGLLLVRRFNGGWLHSAFGSLVFLTMPVFIERVFRHDALASQWMILAALLCYFNARHQAKFPAVGFWVLCALAPGLHTYFLPMVYALLAAALAERMIKNRRFLRGALYLGACFAGTLVVAYALGILTRGGDGGGSGFGEYSMNLNALVNPSSFNWYADSEVLAWSRFLPVLPQRHHQYDGFNYLGLGVLLAWCVMLAYGFIKAVRALVTKQYALFKRAGAFVRGHLPLLACCACLFVFALSNVAVLGERTLYSIPLPGLLLRLCAVFRSSGRLFWPISYLLTLCPLVFFGRAVRGRGKNVAAGLLLAVQLLDTSGVLVQKHQYFANGPIVKQDAFTEEGWRQLVQNHNEVYLLGNIVDYNLAAGIIRYNPGVTTNLILTNRGGFDLILNSYAPMIQELRGGAPIPPGRMYVCPDEGTMNYILETAHPDVRGYFAGGYYLLANKGKGGGLAPITAAG